MIRLTIGIFILLALIGRGFAQEATTEAPATAKISGYVDGYYRYNFNGPSKGFNTGGTSFTNSQNTFQLGMASVKGQYAFDNVDALIDLGFGTRAKEFSYADPDYLVPIKQATISFAPSDKVKFTLGKWATHIGYEVLDPGLNKNYSMSYMFSYGPFSHTGIKADFTLGNGNGAMVGVANMSDVTAPTSKQPHVKTVIAQLSHANESLSTYLNYQGYFGESSIPTASSLNQIDLSIIQIINQKWSIGYNGTVQFVTDDEVNQLKRWWGSAFYINVTPAEKFTVCFRGEYFSDKKDAVKIGANVISLTTSLDYKINAHLLLVPEIRYDHASSRIFESSHGANIKGTWTSLVAAVYTF